MDEGKHRQRRLIRFVGHIIIEISAYNPPLPLLSLKLVVSICGIYHRWLSHKKELKEKKKPNKRSNNAQLKFGIRGRRNNNSSGTMDVRVHCTYIYAEAPFAPVN